MAARIAGELGGCSLAVYSSTLRRAVQTAAAIGAAVGVEPSQDCRLCTWHTPDYADGVPVQEFGARHGLAGGGIYRPFQRGNETWAQMVTRTSQAIIDIADRHRGHTVIIIGHTETVNISFNAVGLLPLYRSFDIQVAPATATRPSGTRARSTLRRRVTRPRRVMVAQWSWTRHISPRLRRCAVRWSSASRPCLAGRFGGSRWRADRGCRAIWLWLSGCFRRIL